MMTEQYQKQFLELLADKTQISGGGLCTHHDGSGFDGIIFTYWPPYADQKDAQVRALVKWGAENLPGLHPSIRVDTAVQDTCLSIRCLFDGIDYSRMVLKPAPYTTQAERDRTDAVIDEARSTLIRLVQDMAPAMGLTRTSEFKPGM